MSAPVEVGEAAPTPELDALGTFKGISHDVDAGLTNVLEHGQVGHGFVQLTGGVDQQAGAFARAEAGWLPRKDLALFGFAQESTLDGGTAGLGARWVF